MSPRACLLAAALLLAAVPAEAAEQAGAEPCRIVRLASLDMSIDSAGGANVPITIAGQTLTLLVDTGGSVSMLTQSAVKALGLEPLAIPGPGYMMFGGKKIDKFVVAHEVAFGGLKASRIEFLVMPDAALPNGVSGTIAPDILRAYDVDFDFARKKFSLFSPEHCRGQVVWWAADYAVVPFTHVDLSQMQIPIELDGKEIDANIDTGTSRTTLSLETAQRLFGFDLVAPQADENAQGGTGHGYRHAFNTLTFAGVTVKNPNIDLVSDRDSKMRGLMVLGMNILAHLHIYIANREEKMYVTPASAGIPPPPSAPVQ